MADKPVTEVVAVDAALDALSSPTSSDVYDAVDGFNEKAVAAAAAARALAGGGSLPAGSFATKEFLLTEEATAGVYSASFPIARYSTVWDVLLIPVAGPWAADSAVLNVSDTQGGAGSYWLDYPVTNLTQWDPTASTIFTANAYNSVPDEGADGAHAYRLATRYTQNSWPPGVTYLNADDTITINLDTAGMSNAPVVPAGQLLIRIRYTTPITPTDADFS